MLEAERTLVVRNSCWVLSRTAANIARSMRTKSVGGNLRATITASSPKAEGVDLGTAKNFSFVGFMNLRAQLGNEIHVKTSGPDAEKVLDLIEKTALEVSERTRREYEATMKYVQGQGDFKRAKRYAAFIESRD